MPQQDTTPIKEKIIETLKTRGPSMPVQIASAISTSPLFTSAFLSELISEKRILMSSMRVGSSPVYYLSGQEQGLEEYSKYLKGKAREAYDLLKSNKFLVDAELPPPIRVAIRSIKDFAKPMNEEGVWRYFLIPREIYSKKEIIKEDKPQGSQDSATGDAPSGESETESKEVIEKEEIKINEKDTPTPEVEREEIKQKIEVKDLDIFDKKTEESFQEVSQHIEEKSFVDKAREYIQDSKIKLIEETDIKKREFLGIGRIETDIGEMELLIVAKDKKSITEKDIEKMFEMISKDRRMILLLSTGEIAKKAKEIYRKHKHIIFFQKISDISE